MAKDYLKTKSQLKLFKDQPKAYGGILLKTRKGRSQGRPLSTKHSMHLVLKSSRAQGFWSFRYASNPIRVRKIILKFASKFGISVKSLANVGNHLHLQIKLGNRFNYKPFIRAVTSAIAMAVTGKNRWNKTGTDGTESIPSSRKFWDYRPFSRVVIGWRALLTLKDYIEVNKWEGEGCSRQEAKVLVAASRTSAAYRNTG